MNNGQTIYQSLLSDADEEARQDYVDPRAQLYQTRNTEQDVGEYTGPSNAFIPQEYDEDLAQPVQDAPEMIEKTSIIIIDTANRDWVAQPNAYSFVFSFGEQLSPTENTILQVPYYYNNPLVPFAAYDMPSTTPTNLTAASPPVQQIPNNRPRIIPGTSTPVPPPLNTPGSASTLGQTYGWRLVLDTSGYPTHIDPYHPVEPGPNANVLYFPVYDPRESRGSTIGVDIIFQGVGSNVGFSTQLKVANVTSLKLARATFPIRKTDPYTAANITSYSLNAIHTEPYILMYIENMKGIYYGSTSNIQNAFAALVQQQRYPVDINIPGVLTQFQDYYPWSKEAFTFDPPLSQLSNAVISIADNNGNFMSHTDDLNIVMMYISPDRNTDFGTITLYLTRDINTISYPSSNLTNYFAMNELRVGDELEFYSPIISKLGNDLNTTDAIQTFFTTLYDQGAYVTKVKQVNLSGSYPLLQMGYAIDIVIKTTDFFNTMAVYSNLSDVVFDLSSTNSNQAIPHLMTFRQLTDISTLDDQFSIPRYSNVPSFFTANYPLPIINVNMQSTYAFEVTTAQPNVALLK